MYRKGGDMAMFSPICEPGGVSAVLLERVTPPGLRTVALEVVPARSSVAARPGSAGPCLVWGNGRVLRESWWKGSGNTGEGSENTGKGGGKAVRTHTGKGSENTGEGSGRQCEHTQGKPVEGSENTGEGSGRQ